VAADRKNAAYLAELIDGLLRHGKKAEAAARLAELEGLAPKHARLGDFQARLSRRDKAGR
jgi:hypothetical protein